MYVYFVQYDICTYCGCRCYNVAWGDVMPYSESSKAASMRYAAKNLKRVPLDMQRTQYDDLKAHAEARGETVNGFIKRAISETMERDNNDSRGP